MYSNKRYFSTLCRCHFEIYDHSFRKIFIFILFNRSRNAFALNAIALNMSRVSTAKRDHIYFLLLITVSIQYLQLKLSLHQLTLNVSISYHCIQTEREIENSLIQKLCFMREYDKSVFTQLSLVSGQTNQASELISTFIGNRTCRARV